MKARDQLDTASERMSSHGLEKEAELMTAARAIVNEVLDSLNSNNFKVPNRKLS